MTDFDLQIEIETRPLTDDELQLVDAIFRTISKEFHVNKIGFYMAVAVRLLFERRILRLDVSHDPLLTTVSGPSN